MFLLSSSHLHIQAKAIKLVVLRSFDDQNFDRLMAKKPTIKSICSKLSQKYTVLSLIKICPSIDDKPAYTIFRFCIFIYTAWPPFWKNWQRHYQINHYFTLFSVIPGGIERSLLESLIVHNLKTGNVQGRHRNIISKHCIKSLLNQNKIIHHFKSSLI